MDTAKKPEEIKLSKSGRIRFTAGFFVCAILWMTGLAIVSAVLLPQHLRDFGIEESMLPKMAHEAAIIGKDYFAKAFRPLDEQSALEIYKLAY